MNGNHFRVVDYRTGQVVYEGKKSVRALTEWNPGTILGQGWDFDEAREDAAEQLASVQLHRNQWARPWNS